jgi:HEPN domain-containing protein
MSVELLIANLLRVAAEDLDGARLLAANANRNAIYLCEQAAEKVIRAIITSEGARAGIKHQLNEMVDLVPDANPLKPALRAIEHLTAYATRVSISDVCRPNCPPAYREGLRRRCDEGRGGLARCRLAFRRRSYEARNAGAPSRSRSLIPTPAH